MLISFVMIAGTPFKANELFLLELINVSGSLSLPTANSGALLCAKRAPAEHHG